MATLERNLRRDLEKAVRKARRVAESGARKVLEQLGVNHHEPYGSMTSEQRALRNRLRVHGRQLGDSRDRQKGTQSMGRLIQECGYEHWHRMLFARFLADADLLIEPQSGVSITLAECQELARETGTDWLVLASDYAERMLPQIFRKDDPVLDISLPPETRSELEDLLKALPQDAFAADDSLGWVYQFWQADKKKEVNRSETKIGADELPAVTQLFTEDYMVQFLLHNTLGAWWAGKVLEKHPDLAATAISENELREACKVGDIEWNYLRFVREEEQGGADKPWRPAAGTFEGWPKAAKDITLFDPCMGSGHFLVFALPILAAFRMLEEELDRRTAVDAVLRDNLFGLEVEQRCTQIAAFNLAFAAWRKAGYRPLPQLNLACSGLAIGVTRAEWMRLAEKAAITTDPEVRRDLFGMEKKHQTVGLEKRVKNGVEALYDLFAKAPSLGSLIDPRRFSPDIFHEGFDKLAPLFGSIMGSIETDDELEWAVAAQGLSKAADLLTDRYVLVATNVPYLVRGKQGDTIRDFSKSYASDINQDLATVFLKRCHELTQEGGAYGVVSPNNWLFLKSYTRFRNRILTTQHLNLIAKVGSGATAQASWDIPRALTVITRSRPHELLVSAGLNTDAVQEDDRAEELRLKQIELATHGHIARVPDQRLAFVGNPEGELLSEFADALQGPSTGDFQRFGRLFWEISGSDTKWEFQQSTVRETKEYSGCRFVVKWDNGEGELASHEGAAIRGLQVIGKRGVAVTQMRELPCSLFAGRWFDTNIAVVLPKREEYLGPIWAYCSSKEFAKNVRQIDEKLGVTNASLVKVPFDVAKWRSVFHSNYGGILPEPNSNDPSEWIHDGAINNSKFPLQNAVAGLLGYKWPRQINPLLGSTPRNNFTPGLVDEDGIVCVTALKGEPPAEHRLNALLAEVYAMDWSASKLAVLLGELGYGRQSLEDWIRDGFFDQHCELFHSRPFIWHIWDGRRDGFHALINYHRLAAPNGEGRRTLEKLIYSYLGDWIDRQRADQKGGVEAAAPRLTHAEHLQGELIKILDGEPPYDIFVRWKPLHQQPIGWDPDINDGVRVNIRPFMTARPLGAHAKNACILRRAPNIRWTKDRGKEPMRDKEDFPWFWGWDEASSDFPGGSKFDGNRWNDLHYSNAFKRAAHARQAADPEAKR